MSDETQEQPAASGEGSTPTAESHGGVLHVPKWVAAVVAAVVLLGAGFGIGWAAAPGGGGDHGAERIGRQLPFNPGGQGPQGEQGQLPTPGNGGLPGLRGAAFLGVTTQPAPSGQQGAQIGSVQSGSPADQAGLKAGDLITAVDGNAVASPQELRQRIVGHQPGDQVTITYTRAGASAQASVKLGTRGANS
jgi:membrane-associated protease RseP (regulator of RpoE activity)